MLKLQFTLRHQDIYLVNRGEVVATDSKNYLVAKFNQLTDDWETPLTAIFTDDKHQQPYAVIVGADSELEENECFVPWEVLTDECNVYVSVYCGNLHTTVTAAFKVRKSGYIDGETPPPPSPTVYDTIIQTLQDLDSGKQDKLTAGTNVTIDENGVISATGGVTDYNNLTNKPVIEIYQSGLVKYYSWEGTIPFSLADFKNPYAVSAGKLGISLSDNVFRNFLDHNYAQYDFDYLSGEKVGTGCWYISKENAINLPNEFEDVTDIINIFNFATPNPVSSNHIRVVTYLNNSNKIRTFIQFFKLTAPLPAVQYKRQVYDTTIWQEIGGGSQISHTLTEQDKQDIADIVIQRLQGGD